MGRSGMASMPGAAAPVVVQPVAVDPLVEPVAEPEADPASDQASDSDQADVRRGKDSEGKENRKKEQK